MSTDLPNNAEPATGDPDPIAQSEEVSRVYNVSTAVVALIEADSPERAIQYLHMQVAAAGFEVFEPEKAHAFESEPVADDWAEVAPPLGSHPAKERR